MRNEEIARIPAISYPTILSGLKMQEAPARIFGAKK